MDEVDEKKIVEIMGEMTCPKDFKCAKSGFENLCKAKSAGTDSYLLCLESDAKCAFTFRLAGLYFCKCPMRVYLRNNLGK